MRRFGIIACLSAIYASGCGSFDEPRGEAGFAPTYEENQDPGLFLEDFDNTRWVANQEGVIHDTGAGILSLATVNLKPEVHNRESLSIRVSQNLSGRINAPNLVIGAEAIISAGDTLELHAEDIVHISGRLEVGPGGLRIRAGKEIRVDGEINSEGPVELSIADADGSLQIEGQVHSTQAGIFKAQGRGQTQISGQILVTATSSNSTIDIQSYGPIEISGRLHHENTSHPHASTSLASLSTVTLQEDAEISASGHGAQYEISGASIYLETEARIIASSQTTTATTGAHIKLIARDTLSLASLCRLEAGWGETGGNIDIQANYLSVGIDSVVQAGPGQAQGGQLKLRIADELDLGPYVNLRAGSADCGKGGDIQLQIGGEHHVSRSAVILAGSAFNETTCVAYDAGGDVDLSTLYANDDLQEIASGGAGDPPGVVHAETNPSLSLSPPQLSALRTEGWLESLAIDRGQIGWFAPFLENIRVMLPPGTSANIFLSGTAELGVPYSEWIPVNDASGSADAQSLGGFRYLRYRIELRGLRFDSPVLDGFALKLTQ